MDVLTILSTSATAVAAAVPLRTGAAAHCLRTDALSAKAWHTVLRDRVAHGKREFAANSRVSVSPKDAPPKRGMLRRELDRFGCTLRNPATSDPMPGVSMAAADTPEGRSFILRSNDLSG